MAKLYKEIAIDALRSIKLALWEIDIPQPGSCPEYIEHHKQIQDVMKIVDKWIDRIQDMNKEKQ